LSFLSGIRLSVGVIKRKIFFSPIKYWEERARLYGKNSVLNLTLNEQEIKSLKDFQLNTIFPVLSGQLTGNEKKLLDFGCGPGRLSVELAHSTGCEVVAADPIEYLLQLGPRDASVTYRKIIRNRIPAKTGEFDIIWICFVLGGIVKRRTLNQTIKEINRVAGNNCLLFIIENTSVKEDIISWKYRSVADYIGMFGNFGLKHMRDFVHANERFSILAGRNTLHHA